MKERLQKLIAAAGLASRREAERWISAGRVTVNGRVAALGDQADPGRDRIAVDGRPLRSEEQKITLMLNKPVGYVTTARDPQGRKVVMELVRDIPARLFPVGRLDINTEGLLLLTNDGDLAARLSHPSHEVAKTYLVRIRGRLTDDERRRLEQGLQLEDGPTAPVSRLKRIRMGFLDLGELRSGQHRLLTSGEVRRLKSL
jgi:23S rRNA pseudouridine2605 synthase